MTGLILLPPAFNEYFILSSKLVFNGDDCIDLFSDVLMQEEVGDKGNEETTDE